MTTDDNILSNLYGNSFHEDELLADADRVLEATMTHQVTDKEHTMLMHDLFFRLANDESRPIEVRADWNALARAYIAQEEL